MPSKKSSKKLKLKLKLKVNRVAKGNLKSPKRSKVANKPRKDSPRKVTLGKDSHTKGLRRREIKKLQSALLKAQANKLPYDWGKLRPEDSKESPPIDTPKKGDLVDNRGQVIPAPDPAPQPCEVVKAGDRFALLGRPAEVLPAPVPPAATAIELPDSTAKVPSDVSVPVIEGAKSDDLSAKKCDKVWELLVRNKWITSGCKSVAEMVEAIEAHRDYVKSLSDAGLEISDPDSMADDYAFFRTEDPRLAAKFDFNSPPEDEDPCEDCGETEEDCPGAEDCSSFEEPDCSDCPFQDACKVIEEHEKGSQV